MYVQVPGSAETRDGRVNRRIFIARLSALGFGSFGMALLAACSSANSGAPAAAPTAPTAPPAKPTAAPASATTAAAPAQPTAPASSAAGAKVITSQPGASVTVGGVRLPTYMPYTAGQPDSPGSPDGMVDPGYKAYPATDR